jgi:hypothetical protein
MQMSEEKDKNIGNDVGKALKDTDTYDKVTKDIIRNEGKNIDSIIDSDPVSGDNTKTEP